MSNQPGVYSHTSESRGAATLKDWLARSLWMEWHDTLVEQMDFCQDAISGKYKHLNLGEKEGRESEAVHTWYWNESQSRSYQAPNWKISPERALLFQQFRSDPNYHLKNLVEMIARNLVEEMLRSDGIDATVSLTSDSDDVFSWVDLIIEVKTPNGKEYTWIDIAISENPRYLAKKEERTETICREFNAYKKHGNKTMPRQVFAIPPRVMAKFLSGYMQRISSGRMMPSSEVLSLFNEAKTKTVAGVRDATQSKVHDIIH